MARGHSVSWLARERSQSPTTPDVWFGPSLRTSAPNSHASIAGRAE